MGIGVGRRAATAARSSGGSGGPHARILPPAAINATPSPPWSSSHTSLPQTLPPHETDTAIAGERSRVEAAARAAALEREKATQAAEGKLASLRRRACVGRSLMLLLLVAALALDMAGTLSHFIFYPDTGGEDGAYWNKARENSDRLLRVSTITQSGGGGGGGGGGLFLTDFEDDYNDNDEPVKLPVFNPSIYSTISLWGEYIHWLHHNLYRRDGVIIVGGSLVDTHHLPYPTMPNRPTGGPSGVPLSFAVDAAASVKDDDDDDGSGSNSSSDGGIADGPLEWRHLFLPTSRAWPSCPGRTARFRTAQINSVLSICTTAVAVALAAVWTIRSTPCCCVRRFATHGASSAARPSLLVRCIFHGALKGLLLLFTLTAMVTSGFVWVSMSDVYTRRPSQDGPENAEALWSLCAPMSLYEGDGYSIHNQVALDRGANYSSGSDSGSGSSGGGVSTTLGGSWQWIPQPLLLRSSSSPTAPSPPTAGGGGGDRRAAGWRLARGAVRGNHAASSATATEAAAAAAAAAVITSQSERSYSPSSVAASRAAEALVGGDDDAVTTAATAATAGGGAAASPLPRRAATSLGAAPKAQVRATTAMWMHRHGMCFGWGFRCLVAGWCCSLLAFFAFFIV